MAKASTLTAAAKKKATAQAQAVANELPRDHRYLVVRGQLFDAAELTPPQVMDARSAEADGEVFCPTCQGPLRVVISERGPVVVHTPENPFCEHEPEDPHSRRAKHLLRQQMQTLFPSGNVLLDAQLPEIRQLPDVALTNPMGGKVVVEYQTQNLTAAQVRMRSQAYEQQGIRCLWLLDSRRLRVTKKGELVKKAMLETLETGLLAAGEPVIYLQAQGREIIWLRPHPDARELAGLGEARIGQVECLVHHYPLSALRLRDGGWWVDHSHDETATPPGPLPANLQKRLLKRRAVAAASTS